MPPLANPIAGPICVEGAERGDVLVVAIEEIVVDDYSWIAIGRGAGRWASRRAGRSFRADYTTKIFRHTPGPSGTTARRHACISVSVYRGRSRRSSARWVLRPIAK